MALRYPSMIPGGVDAGSIIDMFNSGYDRSKARADERKAVDAFGGYLDSVYSGQGAPQSLSALGGMMPAPSAGQVQRSPLPAPTDPATARVEQAFAAQGQGSAPTDLNSNAIAARFLKTVRDGGVTNPYALAAIASTGKRESGFDPKNAVRTWSDPSQSGQAGTAGGIMSWRNERLQALQQFAQQNGDDPRAPSPETQAKFLLAEDPTLIQKLQNAGSAEEAQQMMNNAWRYAGYDQQGGETAQRMALAGQYAQQFGGSPSQQALEGMAVGQSMPMGQGVQIADASGQMMPQGALPQMPDRETMLQLFANPITRPLAIQAAQARIEAAQSQNDPMRRLQYQKALLEIENLRNPQVKPTDTMRNLQWRAQQAGLQPGTPEYNQFMVTGGSGGTSLTVGPDGTVQFSQGGASGQKLTEGQSKDVGYYTRGLDADAKLAELDTQLTDWTQQNADKIPLGLGNYLRDPSFRQAKQAADSFLTAVLRKDTGAAITSQEFEIYGPMFLPAPGDDQATINQKRQARQVALMAIRSGLGTAEAVAKANEVTLGLPPANPANAAGGALPDGVSEEDIQHTMKKHGLSREEVLRRIAK